MVSLKKELKRPFVLVKNQNTCNESPILDHSAEGWTLKANGIKENQSGRYVVLSDTIRYHF